MAENRMKMHAKETPWGKYLRLNELARHRKRCQTMKCSVDTTAPEQSPQQKMNRERSDLEQGIRFMIDCFGYDRDTILQNTVEYLGSQFCFPSSFHHKCMSFQSFLTKIIASLQMSFYGIFKQLNVCG